MSNSLKTKQLVVIGGGIGGYTAAIRAARSGLAVTLIEKEMLGGTCLNTGCIPTKSLLHQSHQFRNLANFAHFGVNEKAMNVDFSTVIRKKNEAVQKLVRGVASLVKLNKIKLIKGSAEFVDSNTLRVTENGELLKPDFIVIATGSETIIPPIPGVDSDGVVSSHGALAMTTLPRRVLIIGGGVIGVEFAQIFSDFRSEVTIIEKMHTLVSEEDIDVTEVLQKKLALQGIEIATSSEVVGISRVDGSIKVLYSSKSGDRELIVDTVLVAVGRRPRFKDLALERAGIDVNLGSVVTDEYCRTNVSHVYAVGDVRGGLLLAHKAAAEAECSVAHILGHSWSMATRVVPRAVYTSPEIAAVGLNEKQARSQYPNLKIGKFPFSASGKAITDEDVGGFVKILADGNTDQVVGISMIGVDATNLLGEATLAVQMELTLPALMETIHAHPTRTEALMEAAHDAYDGAAIHLPPRTH